MSLMSGSTRPIATAADVRDLASIGEFTVLTARAALAAGYKLELRTVRYERMLYADGKHFHPFTCWEQCVRLIVDTKSCFTIYASGALRIENEIPENVGYVQEYRQPTTDAEYRNQMCDAVVRNVAKGFPV